MLSDTKAADILNKEIISVKRGKKHNKINAINIEICSSDTKIRINVIVWIKQVL